MSNPGVKKNAGIVGSSFDYFPPVYAEESWILLKGTKIRIGMMLQIIKPDAAHLALMGSFGARVVDQHGPTIHIGPYEGHGVIWLGTRSAPREENQITGSCHAWVAAHQFTGISP